jgi:hypothetical protein
MKLHIQTQVYENYGAHDWDGTGACPQYWKAKGGNDYMVPKVKNAEEATAAIMCLREKIEESNEYFRENIIGWDLVDNKFRTEFEQSQLEHEGQIRFPAKVLTW